MHQPPFNTLVVGAIRESPSRSWGEKKSRVGRKKETPGRGLGGSEDPPMPLDAGKTKSLLEGSLLFMLDSSPIRDGHRRSSVYRIGRFRGTFTWKILSQSSPLFLSPAGPWPSGEPFRSMM